MFWEEPRREISGYNGKQTAKGFRNPAGFWTREETEHPAASVLTAFLAPCPKTQGCAIGLAQWAIPALFHSPPPLTSCSSSATFKAGKSSGHVRQLRFAQQEDHGIALSASQRAHLASSLGTSTLQGERRQQFASSPRRARCVPALVGNWLTAVFPNGRARSRAAAGRASAARGGRTERREAVHGARAGRNPRTPRARKKATHGRPRPSVPNRSNSKKENSMCSFPFLSHKTHACNTTLHFSHGVSYKSSAQW